MINEVLITAGATRNNIDSMRVITANSTGRTGVLIANLLQDRGYSVHFLGSPLALSQPECPEKTEEYSSTDDLLEKMRLWIQRHPNSIVVHCAAVGDFTVKNSESAKIPSGKPITLTLHPTPKILDQIKVWDEQVTLASFKAAPPLTSHKSLAEICLRQLQRTQSDVVLGNVLGRLQKHVLIQTSENSVWFQNRDDGLSRLVDELEEISARKKI